MSGRFSVADLAPEPGHPVAMGAFSLADLAPEPAAGRGQFSLADLAPEPAAKQGQYSPADLATGPTPGAVVDQAGPEPNAPAALPGLSPGPSPGELMAGGFEGLDLAPAGTPGPPEPKETLPPGVLEDGGLYYRQMPDGSLMLVGEKGLVQPMYDPIELAADLATGGISGAARLAGRSMLRLATREGLGELVRQGLRSVAGAVAKGAARDAGFGALAGGTMEAVEHGTGNQAGAFLAGMGAPVAAAVGPMVVRRGLAKMADNAAGSVGQAVAKAAGNEGWQASQSKLAQRFGTLSEAIGSEAYGAVARAEASQALDATRIAAETGEYTLRPWVQTVMQGIPWLRDDRALIIGQGLRDLVNRIPGVGEALAGKLGLTNADLHQLTRLAEVIPAWPLDRGGNLRLGIKEWVKDADGASKQVWRHDLTPEAARAEVASLKPAALKFLMAYVEPAEGFHLPPRLAPVGQVPGEGVDLGQWSLEQLAARTRMTPEALAANYAIWGSNGFLAGFGSGDDASRVLASRALKHIEEDPSRYLKVLSYQEPEGAMDAGLGRTVAEGLAPVRPGKVGLINDQVAQEINQLGFSTGPSAVMLTPDKLPHLKQRHGGQLTAQDWRQVQRTIEEPQEVLPNLATAQSPERSRSVLLVRQEGKSYVSIVEITAGDEANQLWNFWKMSAKKAESYLRKFREEKARRLQPGGAASSPIFLPSAQRLEGGKPEGLSGSQTAATSLDSMVVGRAGEVKPGPGKKALDQAAGQAGDLGNLLPDDSGGPAPRLAGQVGRAAADWRAPGAVEEGTVYLPYSPRRPGQKPGGISREVNFADMVRLGVLQPNQRLQGYVTHAGTSEKALAAAAEAGRLNQRAPELSLEPMVPGFARERVDALGKAPRLDEAITAYRGMGATVKAQRELLAKLGPLLLDEVPPQRKFMDGVWVTVPGNPPAKDLVRTRTEWSPWAGKMVTRQEPLSLVDVGPIEAEALGVRAGRHTIPTAFAERFDVLLGRIKQGKLDTPLEGLATIARDLARYWKVNVLAAPGTVATNFISGGLQYGAKTMGDLVRHGLTNPRRVLDDFSAPLHALRPSMIEAVPAEILGGNVATQFGREASEFYKGVSARLAAGEKVGLPTRAAAAVSEYLLKTLNFMLKPFGAVENYWKRSLYLSETMDWARRESKRLAAQGEQVRPQDLVASVFQQRPDLHREVMQGAVDRFGMDYDNVPTWLKRFRESLVGAATAPFPVYPYKYARTIGSHLNAFNPLNRGLSAKERAARAAELIIPLSAYAAGRKHLAGGDSQVEADRERFEADYGDSGIKPDYPKLGGRDHVASYRDHRPDPRDLAGRPSQGWDKEVFLRTAKYPYVNLSHALSGWEEAKDFGDEFKSTGPLVPLIMNILEADMRQGPRDYPGQLGRLLSELIPAHRMVEFLAAVNDDFRKRAPKGFWEQIMLKFPGAREYLHQPDDKWAGKLAQEERGAEWLKFLAGVNLRTVDVASAKEATSEAVVRASERGLKDSQRLAFYSTRTGLAPEVLEPHLAKIRQAETNGLLLYRQVERTFFGQALKAGVNVLDPGQASAVNQAKRKVGREVVTHGLGARTQAQADQGARLLFGLTWINQNLGNAGGVGSGR